MENDEKKILLHSNKFIAILVAGIDLMLMLFSNLVLASYINVVDSFSKMKINNYSVSFKSLFHFQISNYLLYYMFFLIIIIIADIKMVYSIKTSFRNINKGQKGTSEFTTLKELKRQYKAIPEKKYTYKGGGGIAISHYKNKTFIDDSAVNNLIIGTTRSGKGETFVFPTIDAYSRAEKKPSLILNDPKGELVSASYDTLKKRGYDIQVLNLIEPDISMSYNPLQIIIDAYKAKEYSTAQMLCNTLTFSLYNDPTAKDKFWQESAQSLVNALILSIIEDCVAKRRRKNHNLYCCKYAF